MESDTVRKFVCLRCEHRWEVPFGSGRQMVCPSCGSMKIRRTNPEELPPAGKGRRRRHRQGRPDQD